jgi:outer membrane protein assembly factor BamB
VDCGSKHHVFGTSNSPVLYEKLVIINASVECGDLIALDKETGSEIWRVSGMVESWNTPTLVKTAEGKTELVVHIKGKILAFDPQTGKELWNCQGISDYICPSILAEGDMVYAIGGRQNMAIAVRSGGSGDVTDSHVVWKIRKGSNVVSPVFHDGYLYWAKEEKGIAYCVKADDGKVMYEKRMGVEGKLYASPIAVDGKIYYVSREGGTFVLPAKPEFEKLAHNVIDSDDSIFNGSPIVSDGDLLLRSDKFLYCIGNR